MLHYLSTITLVSSVMLMKINTEEADREKARLWAYLRKKSPAAYRKFKRSLLGNLAGSHGKFKRMLTMGGYKIARKWIGFN